MNKNFFIKFPRALPTLTNAQTHTHAHTNTRRARINSWHCCCCCCEFWEAAERVKVRELEQKKLFQPLSRLLSLSLLHSACICMGISHKSQPGEQAGSHTRSLAQHSHSRNTHSEAALSRVLTRTRTPTRTLARTTTCARTHTHTQSVSRSSFWRRRRAPKMFATQWRHPNGASNAQSDLLSLGKGVERRHWMTIFFLCSFCFCFFLFRFLLFPCSHYAQLSWDAAAGSSQFTVGIVQRPQVGYTFFVRSRATGNPIRRLEL